MNKLYYFLNLTFLFIILFPLISRAQHSYLVVGSITDSLDKNIGGATIQMRTVADVEMTISDNTGRFFFQKARSLPFEITVKALNYMPDSISSTRISYTINDDTIKLKSIILKSRVRFLKEVIVKSPPPPIIFKKDTTEYNAAYFLNNTDNVIQDLLARLPGLSVSNEGIVSSQGESLTRILVNGKEFFTGNITEYIKELPVGIVSKIQIVNDYGKESNFSGIKTGNPVKVLNVILKPGINHGIFGLLTASAQTTNQYGIGGNANYWANSRQIEVNGLLNTASNASGINNINSGGVSYRDTWSKKITVNLNYNIRNNNVNTLTSSYTQAQDELGQLTTYNSGRNQYGSLSQTIGMSINFVPDTSSYYSFSPDVGFNSNSSIINLLSKETGVIIQNVNSSTTVKASSPVLGGILSYVHRFKKNGRTINLSFSSTQNNGNNSQNSSNKINYFSSGQFSGDSLSNRLITNQAKTNIRTFNINYTEPINNEMFIDVSYINSRTSQNTLFLTSGILPNGTVYSIDSLTNINRYIISSQKIEFQYHYTKGHITTSIGASIQPTTTNESYLGEENNIENSFVNLSPTAAFEYLFSSRDSFNINYYGYTTVPTYYQLQSVPDTRNIQNIIIGNPNLKTSFTHTININFRHTVSSGFTLMTNGGLSYTQNSIVTDMYLRPDTLNSLTMITTYKNANNTYRINGGYQLSSPTFKLNELKCNIHLNGVYDLNNSIIYSNFIRGDNKNTAYNQSLAFDIMNDKFLSSFGSSYSLLMNSIYLQNINLSSIKTYNFFIKGDLSLQKTQISLEANKLINEGYIGIIAPNSVIINCSLTRSLLKHNLLNITIRGNDLLNQGNQISRSTNGILVVDTKNNIVTRYLLLTISIRLNKFN